MPRPRRRHANSWVFQVCRKHTSDLAEMLFPSNQNQVHAAVCILFELKWAEGIVPSLSSLEARYSISRRTLQRTRAKLARLGLIEHMSALSARSRGQAGWKLSGRFASALRQLADKAERWQDAKGPGRREKDEMLLEICRPPGRPEC
jgi:hypothetical protein